jgi:hypothetical protein
LFELPIKFDGEEALENGHSRQASATERKPSSDAPLDFGATSNLGQNSPSKMKERAGEACINPDLVPGSGLRPIPTPMFHLPI